MTNEELAIAIQNGKTELYPVLWEQVRRLIHYKAERYAFQLENSGRRIDPVDFRDDLIQSAYFAVIDAVNYFDPASGLKFLTYLNRPLLNEFQRTAGIRTSRRDILDTALYLDAPVGDDQESYKDTVPDPTDDMASSEESVYIWELREALDYALGTLSERERQTLTDWYFYGVSYADQAEKQGVTRAYINHVANQAMDKLRSNRQIMEELAEFMPTYNYDPYKFTGLSAWKQTDMTVQDRTLMTLLV